MAKKNYNGVEYDDSVDYSVEIERAEQAGEDTTALKAARQAKIDDKYAGKEPTMWGSDTTYSQASSNRGGTSTNKSGRKTNNQTAIDSAMNIAQVKQNQATGVTGGGGAYTPVKDRYDSNNTPTATRDPSLAGKIVKMGDYSVYYNENGYVSKKVKDGGAAAVNTIRTTHANDSALHQAAYIAAANGDWDKVSMYLNQISTQDGGHRTNADAYGWELQREFGLDAKSYYDRRYDEANGAGSSAIFDATGGKIKSYSALVDAVGEEQAQVILSNLQSKAPQAQAQLKDMPQYSPPSAYPGTGSGSAGLDIGVNPGSYAGGSLGDYLDQWLLNAQKQQTNQIDFATQQAIQELQRAEQDAQVGFQNQRNQIAIDEATAKDNQALYAERRGDKGGIGAAQYDSIMNTAAQNRLAVNQAQQKLATDTARQIADLRAQGEFEKADALLQLSQTYLSQLIQLEQWSLEYGLSVAQFNASLQQWAAEFELAASDVTGYYNGTPTLSNQKWQTELMMAEQERLAEQGWMLLEAGMPPSDSQLTAMGVTRDQATNMITAAKLASVSKGAGGGSGASVPGDIYSQIFASGATTEEDAWAYLVSNGYKSQTDVAQQLAYQYADKYNSGAFHDAITWNLLQKGYSMSDPSIWNDSRTTKGADGNEVTQIRVDGFGWVTLDEVEAGVRTGKMDVVPNVSKNQITIMQGVRK